MQLFICKIYIRPPCACHSYVLTAALASYCESALSKGKFINISHFMGLAGHCHPGAIKCKIFMNPPTSGHPFKRPFFEAFLWPLKRGTTVLVLVMCLSPFKKLFIFPKYGQHLVEVLLPSFQISPHSHRLA